MIRKLRLKFICVNMLIVTLMLTAIFGMVYRPVRAWKHRARPCCKA